MNVATIKTLLFLVSLGLFGGLAYYAYQKKQEQLDPYVYFDEEYAKSVLDNIVRPETPKANIVAYDAVVSPVMMKFDWTGAPPKKRAEIEAAQDPNPVKRQPVIADLLTIQMVQVAARDPGESLALVAWKSPDLQKAPGVLTIGKKLPAPHDIAIVKDIRAEGLEFAFTDEEFEPEFVKVPRLAEGVFKFLQRKEDLVGPPTSSSAPVPGTVAVWRERTEQIAPGMYEIGSRDFEDFGTSYQRMLTEDVKTETVVRDGKRVGLKLTEVRAGSLAASHGATSGDVIISINGHGVSSEQEAIQYVKQNANNTTVWQVVVENLGRQRTITYTVPKKN